MTKAIITDDVCFTSGAWKDYLFWQETDPARRERINVLIKEIRRAPFSGLGKPEPLKSNLTGWWSRRIDREHRLVYRVVETTTPKKGSGETEKVRQLQIASCRFHY